MNHLCEAVGPVTTLAEGTVAELRTNQMETTLSMSCTMKNVAFQQEISC